MFSSLIVCDLKEPIALDRVGCNARRNVKAGMLFGTTPVLEYPVAFD
jgi:hypothetical protein